MINDDDHRGRLARELHGRGVEFGPGCHPLAVGPFVTSIKYCDAHDRAAFAGLFKVPADEIGGFPERIDFRLQFDREPFVDVIGRESLNFVVANHLVEHLVDPIRFLEQCYAVLAPGGMLFLGLPDKRRSFDRDRRRTTLEDLIARNEAGVTEASDERILEFVNQVERSESPVRLTDPGVREYLAEQRRKSVHLNVWVPDDVIELFLYFGRRRGMPWTLYDGALGGDEFLFLFCKTERAEALDLYPSTLTRLYADATRRHIERVANEVAALRDEVSGRSWLVRGIRRMTGRVRTAG
jgi:SAM-dependent methyltransferase